MAKEGESKKKRLSTGAWIAISCGGCLVLVIIVVIIIVAVAAGKSDMSQISSTNTPNDTDSHGYPQEAKTNFISRCQLSVGAESFQSYCECTFDYIENKYSYDQFKQMSDEYAKTKTLPQGIAEAGASCVKQSKK